MSFSWPQQQNEWYRSFDHVQIIKLVLTTLLISPSQAEERVSETSLATDYASFEWYALAKASDISVSERDNSSLAAALTHSLAYLYFTTIELQLLAPFPPPDSLGYLSPPILCSSRPP